jgi:hypothetical protein
VDERLFYSLSRLRGRVGEGALAASLCRGIAPSLTLPASGRGDED